MIEELREELRYIREHDYAVPEDADAYPYAQMLLECLGSPCAELRDRLAYTTLARWISRDEFRHKELRGLLLQALSPNGLFFQIGEAGTDSVFKRAFSVLLVPMVVAAHERNSFLSEEQLKSTAEQVIEYVYLEQDMRGYVEGKGWAHAAAHAADALAALARVLPDRKFAASILDAVLYIISRDDMVYAHFEDERLAAVVLAVRQSAVLSNEEWTGWLQECSVLDTEAQPARDRIVQNRKLLLRSVYFAALEPDEEFAAFLMDALRTLQNG